MPNLLLGGLGLLSLLLVGVVGTLWLAGVSLNPFASTDPKEDPYMVRIPINAQAIPAYSPVERSHLVNPANGRLLYQQVPPDATVGMSVVGIDQNASQVEGVVKAVKNVDDRVVFVVNGASEIEQANAFTLGGAIMNVNSIIGRVVKADKRAGLGFRESTFFERGTPAGLAGATPQGMRAITLDATTLTGVHALNAGDQIDLLASMPRSDESSAQADTASEVRLLAQNAKVLRPVYVRNEVSTTASLTSGKRLQNEPKYEVAIAVAADDVIPLQNAIDQSLSITCIARSMKPVDPEAGACDRSTRHGDRSSYRATDFGLSRCFPRRVCQPGNSFAENGNDLSSGRGPTRCNHIFERRTRCDNTARHPRRALPSSKRSDDGAALKQPRNRRTHRGTSSRSCCSRWQAVCGNASSPCGKPASSSRDRRW